MPKWSNIIKKVDLPESSQDQFDPAITLQSDIGRISSIEFDIEDEIYCGIDPTVVIYFSKNAVIVDRKFLDNPDETPEESKAFRDALLMKISYDDLLESFKSLDSTLRVDDKPHNGQIKPYSVSLQFPVGNNKNYNKKFSALFIDALSKFDETIDEEAKAELQREITHALELVQQSLIVFKNDMIDKKDDSEDLDVLARSFPQFWLTIAENHKNNNAWDNAVSTYEKIPNTEDQADHYKLANNQCAAIYIMYSGDPTKDKYSALKNALNYAANAKNQSLCNAILRMINPTHQDLTIPITASNVEMLIALTPVPLSQQTIGIVTSIPVTDDAKSEQSCIIAEPSVGAALPTTADVLQSSPYAVEGQTSTTLEDEKEISATSSRVVSLESVSTGNPHNKGLFSKRKLSEIRNSTTEEKAESNVAKIPRT